MVHPENEIVTLNKHFLEGLLGTANNSIMTSPPHLRSWGRLGSELLILSQCYLTRGGGTLSALAAQLAKGYGAEEQVGGQAVPRKRPRETGRLTPDRVSLCHVAGLHSCSAVPSFHLGQLCPASCFSWWRAELISDPMSQRNPDPL